MSQPPHLHPSQESSSSQMEPEIILQAQAAQPSARALRSITALLHLLIMPCFYYTASLRSLCNFTASLHPRTGAPAAFVINHFIKNIGQEVLSHPLSPINLLNCLLNSFFNCSTIARQEETCTPFPNSTSASPFQSSQSPILGWFLFHNTFQKSTSLPDFE